MRTKIDFSSNVPVKLSLAYAEGKPVASSYGPQLMFSTTDNRCFFLSEPAAASVNRQMVDKGIRPRLPVAITKSVTTGENGKPQTRWLIDRASAKPAAGAGGDPKSPKPPMGRQPDGTFAVPALPETQPSLPDSEIMRLLRAAVQAEVDKRLGKWNAKPLGQAGMHEPPALSSDSPSGSAETAAETRLEDALILAVTAAHKATLHAKQIGFQMPAFSGEDLRCMANTVVIQGGR
jgi:hypothetical protein